MIVLVYMSMAVHDISGEFIFLHYVGLTFIQIREALIFIFKKFFDEETHNMYS